LSRPERSFSPAGEARLAADELAALLAAADGDDGWQRAVACYLAGGDGWREAEAALGGAFAADAAAAVRLSRGKSE
jgi:hypothetical protein